MPSYYIHEVDSRDPHIAYTIVRLNALSPDIFPQLEERHLDNGHWFFAFLDEETEPAAFAGFTTFEPFKNVAYFKRCWVRDHGHGLQLRLMTHREIRCRQLGFTHIVSDCGAGNSYSARNFRRSGFETCDPEQRWAEKEGPSLYWIKTL